MLKLWGKWKRTEILRTFSSYGSESIEALWKLPQPGGPSLTVLEAEAQDEGAGGLRVEQGPVSPAAALQASALQCWQGKLGPGFFQRLCPQGPGLPPDVFNFGVQYMNGGRGHKHSGHVNRA